MKRALLSLLLLLSTVFAVPLVQAEEVLNPACTGVTNSALCENSRVTQNQSDNSFFGPNGILTKVAGIVTILAGAAAVIMIIVGGLQYVIASGDPTNIQNAKNTILYAIIGLLVALLAQAIIRFVLVKL